MNATGKLIKLGLIGAGKWGQNYIRTIGRSNDARLVRLTSSNPEAGNLVGADCTISNDWRDLINDTDIDGLILAVPPTTQVQIALAALENKIPLLLEKPLATTVADAKRISDLAVKNNVPVLVDHIYLFHPAYEALKREAKNLEQIKSINSTGGDTGPFRADWNPLWDWGPHDVAMCLDLTGEYPSNISAKRDEVKTKHGVGEIFNAKLEFPSGITANISFGNGMTKKTRRLSVMGDACEIVFDDTTNEKVVQIKGGQRISIDVSPELALDLVIETFANGLRAGDRGFFGTAIASKVVQVLAEIERQCKTS